MTSKRFKKLLEKTSETSSESIEKLIPLVKKNCTTKLDESIDLSFQINNKQKKNEINIRTVVNLPGGSGKKVKVAVVCEDANLLTQNLLVQTLLEEMILLKKLKMEKLILKN